MANQTPACLDHLERVKSSLPARRDLYREIRRYFESQNFLEVETPALAKCPGLEVHLRPFQTRFIPEGAGQERVCYLITSPEYAMKKILCGGFEKIFQICKSFRNGEAFGRHNPEFTILEWYRAHQTYDALIADFEALLPKLAQHFHGKLTSTWNGKTFHWQPPFERIRIADAFADLASVNLTPPWTSEHLFDEAQKAGLNFSTHENAKTISWDDLYTRILVERVEPKLPNDRPFVLTDYPKPQAALAQLNERNPEWAERFEIYLGSLELANGFSELTDATEQRRRFEEELRQRRALGRETPPIDEDFLEAMAARMPQAAGVAMGLDRLLMVLLNKTSIGDVLAFPYSL